MLFFAKKPAPETIPAPRRTPVCEGDVMATGKHPFAFAWRRGIIAASLAGVASMPAQALVIDTTFDSSVTSLSNASTVEGYFNAVTSIYQTLFKDPVTVNITVSWGSVGGVALPSNAIGASLDPLYGYYTYNQIRSALFNDRKTVFDLSSLSHTPNSAPSGTTLYAVPSAEAKALGLIPATQTASDGAIGFAGSSTSGFTYGRSGIAAGTYDFIAVAEHEVAEVLGRISGVDASGTAFRTPLDLFRFLSPGVLSTACSDPAYLSIDGGTTSLGKFNNSPSGGDCSDWLTTATSTDASDAFISTGQQKDLSLADLQALDITGWDFGVPGIQIGASTGAPTAATLTSTLHTALASIPEPSALLPILSGALVLFGWRRRRVRAAP